MNRRPQIAIVDYGMGNRRSAHKALEHVGADVATTSSPSRIGMADGLVVPGVGAFPLAMGNLHELGLAELIVARAGDGVPILGICLGMQLLFDRSCELEPTAGLGLISGDVTWLATDGLRIPHIGWNDVTFVRDSPLLTGLPAGGCPFYHVHSLVAHPTHESDVIATATYGERFATVVARGSVLGVQFHPEKSSAHGLRMLRSFVELCGGGVAGARSAAALRA